MAEEVGIRASEVMDGGGAGTDGAAAPVPETASVPQTMAAIDERLEIEAIAQMVESMGQSKELDRRLKRAFGELRQRVVAQESALTNLQRELRAALLDIELLRRAATSAGQAGVLGRRQMERELVRAVLPPEADHSAVGVKVNRQAPRNARVDCASRLHLCKAACCRIFSVPLTASEVDSDRYDWDPKEPYNLRRTRTGCVHLQAGGCACTVREERPLTCSNYSCENDKRIWQDFENHVLDPALAKRLEALDVATPAPPRPSPEDAQPVAARAAEATNGAAAIEVPTAARPATAMAMSPEAEEKPAASGVQAPDFSALRANRPAEPTQRFVPPPKDGA